MRTALLKSGAIETLDLMRADREPGEAWHHWLDVVPKHLGIAQGDVVTPAFDRPVTLTLASCVQLNDPNNPDTNEAWSLLFESAEPLDFRAGDLLMVSPREGEPERAYSIGSSALVNPRQILLTVGLISRTDAQGNEQLGAMSGILCRRLRAGEGEPDRPVLMLATGCGIAPFVGFLSEHAAAHRAGVTWLIFGNRKRAGDFFYRERLESWAQIGVLSRLDTAFSRDPEDGAYVQDRLVQSGAEVLKLLERGGILYVCGRASTIGTGVRTALQQILAREKSMQPSEAEAQLERWQGKASFGSMCSTEQQAEICGCTLSKPNASSFWPTGAERLTRTSRGASYPRRPPRLFELDQCKNVQLPADYHFRGKCRKTKKMKNLRAILQAFRHDLPNSSVTARAIDRDALLEEISQAAALERVHQLAAILFEAEQEEAHPTLDREIDLETLINNQIRGLRNKLPDESKTAKAIDRGAAWAEISESAQEEGLGNMAAMLFEAEQEEARERT